MAKEPPFMPDAGTTALATLLSFAAKRVTMTERAQAQMAMENVPVRHTTFSAKDIVLTAFCNMAESRMEEEDRVYLIMRVPELKLFLRPFVDALSPRDRISDKIITEVLGSFGPKQFLPSEDKARCYVLKTVHGRHVDYRISKVSHAV